MYLIKLQIKYGKNYIYIVLFFFNNYMECISFYKKMYVIKTQIKYGKISIEKL